VCQSVDQEMKATEINDIASNPFIVTAVVVSVVAGVLLIVAVMLLILLIRQRTDDKRSCHLFCSYYNLTVISLQASYVFLDNPDSLFFLSFLRAQTLFKCS